ncbi:hypothetical protein TOPH_08254 [Tolypocladium ophioglossoides CBS 100239]|uniref:Uncharacterized protein n=1 Tax=Tolypocladium ophioglossoides (strain CBS 100239) TaxID=1163406 RepID=A0A0L0N006_TOLOC|nr:hypothetical protein TOPH_08254 [Tolypocladium ophioglossoides CBS 100239]
MQAIDDGHNRGTKRVADTPPQPSSGPPAQHIASCHCGKFQAKLLVPIQEQEVKEDNCSSCVRNANVGVYPAKDQVRIRGREHAVEYLHGRKYRSGSHCGTRGVSVFGTQYGPPLRVFDSVPPERLEHVMSVYHKDMNMSPLNVRAIKGLDLASIQINGSEGCSASTMDNHISRTTGCKR